MNKRQLFITFFFMVIANSQLHCMMRKLKQAIVVQDIGSVKQFLEDERLSIAQQTRLWHLAADQLVRSEQRLSRWHCGRVSNLILGMGRLAAAGWGGYYLMSEQEKSNMLSYVLITQSIILTVDGFHKFFHAVTNESSEHNYAAALGIKKLIEDYQQPEIELE